MAQCTHSSVAQAHPAREHRIRARKRPALPRSRSQISREQSAHDTGLLLSGFLNNRRQLHQLVALANKAPFSIKRRTIRQMHHRPTPNQAMVRFGNSSRQLCCQGLPFWSPVAQQSLFSCTNPHCRPHVFLCRVLGPSMRSRDAGVRGSRGRVVA
jgi:hypothetical protein